MKKLLRLFVLVVFLPLFIGSCVEDHYNAWTFASEYEIGYRNGIYAWDYDEIDDLFFCRIPVRELTRNIYEEGMLAAYIVYYVDDQKVDSPLPYSDFYMENGYQYSHQYTCEFSPGWVTFTFRDSNFSIDVPPAATFVLKMLR